MRFPKKIFRALLLLGGGIGFIASRMDKKKKFSWKRICFVLFLLGFVTLSASAYTVFSKYESKFTGKTPNCAVVFGAAVWKGSTPSHALYDRIVAGVDLYNKEHVACLVFSGGNSTYGDHEADVMAQIALQAGIPEKDIIKDYHGDNTLRTIQNLKKKEGYVFVSNDFHLGRISLIAHQQGFENFYLHKSPYIKGRYLKEMYFVSREIAGVILLALLTPLML